MRSASAPSMSALPTNVGLSSAFAPCHSRVPFGERRCRGPLRPPPSRPARARARLSRDSQGGSRRSTVAKPVHPLGTQPRRRQGRDRSGPACAPPHPSDGGGAARSCRRTGPEPRRSPPRRRCSASIPRPPQDPESGLATKRLPTGRPIGPRTTPHTWHSNPNAAPSARSGHHARATIPWTSRPRPLPSTDHPGSHRATRPRPTCPGTRAQRSGSGCGSRSPFRSASRRHLTRPHQG